MFWNLSSDRTAAVLVAAILLIFSGSSTVIAQSDPDWVPRYNPTMHVTRAPGEIKIDGFLDDAGWQGAAMADHFHENGPGDQTRPPVETKAFITYDQTHLYVSAVCYADPSLTRATMCQRDRLYSNDNIGFFFETYGDAAWAYTLNVNAYGNQADALWSNGFGEDGMFDLVFESAGQITDSGYQVEMAIPFASLRFPDKEKQTWRVQFWRHHNRESHYSIVWSAEDQSESIWINRWGTVTGIENVSPGRGIELISAWTGSRTGELEMYADSSLEFNNYDIHGEPSLSGKYTISSNMTVDATINPDFSNVESDAFQIDVNSPTALFYPEKRPFFQEGSDLYRTRLNLVYTRSINDPDFAAKFTGRLGRTSISYLGAHDRNSPFVIPYEETSSPTMIGGKSLSNILRVRRTIGAGSQVGLLLTDRRWEGGGSGSALAFDATLRPHQRVIFRGQVVGSYTDEPNDPSTVERLGSTTFDHGNYTAAYDGESFSGFAASCNLSYQSRNVYASASYSEYGPTFRAENGWVPRNSRRSVTMFGQYHWRFDDGLVERISLAVNPLRIWNTDGIKKDEAIFLSMNVPLRFYQTNLGLSHMISTEDFGGTYYDDIWDWTANINSTPSELIAFGATFGYGNQITYRNGGALGRQTRKSGWVDLRPNDHILLETWINHFYSEEVITDSLLVDEYVWGSRLNYQHDRRLSVRLFAQYYSRIKAWALDPLVTYQITPFTLFYAGSTYFYYDYPGLNQTGDRLAREGEPSYSHNQLLSRQFFVKLQYLFQI